jgi:hypothetical protein
MGRRLLAAAILLCAGMPGAGCKGDRTTRTLAAAVDARQLGWVERAGGRGLDEGRGIAVDGAGNSLVTGGFTGPATFGAGERNKTILTSQDGSLDAFVAKLAGNGTLIWATQAGGAGIDEGVGAAADAGGNALVAGVFTDCATFGKGPARATVSSAGESDVFVAKYDPDGSLRWVTRAGGTEADGVAGIAADAAGNGLVAGTFFGAAAFGAGASQTTLTSAGFSDLFVARYDPDGLLLWARRAGGTSYESASGIAADASGSSYVTGRFAGAATFGPGEANETTLTGSGVYLARFGAGGSLLWARAISGALNAGGIAVDAAGNGTVTGSFVDPADFGGTILTSAGRNDIFVARYAPDGLLLWARRDGGADEDFAPGVAVDAAGNATVAGFFRGAATFGAGEAAETTIASAGDFDAFVADYDPDGALLGARRAGGAGFDSASGVAVDAAGHSAVTGAFGGVATFDAGDAGLATLTSAGESDVFVARYAVTSARATTGMCPDGALLAKVVETTPALDAADVDVSSLRLAGASPSSCALEDADGDGDLDLVCKFHGHDLDLGSGSVVAVLTGTTFSGLQILGDPIKLFRCR